MRLRSLFSLKRTLALFALLLAAVQTGYAQLALAGARPVQGAAASGSVLVNGTPTITTTDGVKLYTKVAGRGMPCVFIHGGPGSGSQIMETLAGKDLEQQFQMIYLDQRGSGRSASAPDKDYSLARVVQDLEELRQQLHLNQWVVMAHSFGGIIAAEYASKYPERVQGLVLVNSILHLPVSMESTVAHGYSLLPEQGRPPLDPAAPLPQRYGMVMSLLNQQKRMGLLMYAHDSTAQRVQRAMKGAAANRDFATVVTQSAAIVDYLQDFTVKSASMQMPVLVIAGRDDQLVGPTHHNSFRFVDQQVVTLPGKHFALLENALEVKQVLAPFVARVAVKRVN